MNQDQAIPTASNSSMLNIPAVRAWLGSHTELSGDLRAERIPGGRSHLTYVLSDAAARRFVLRRPPDGERLPGAHDIQREYAVVASLHGTDVPVARPIAYCGDPEVTGAEFSVSRFVAGHTLRTPADVSALTPAGRGALTSHFAETLATLHRVDIEAVNLPPTTGEDYLQRQLHVWQRQLDATEGRTLPLVRRIAADLLSGAPRQRRTSIVHGDYRLDNVLLSDDGQVLAVIDWELWSVGDPLADLGATLACWIEPADELNPLGSSPTTNPSLGSRDDLVESYASASNLAIDSSDIGYYLAFGTWRFAAILEGVYRRNQSGAYGDHTDDGDWRRFEVVVPRLLERAADHLSAVR